MKIHQLDERPAQAVAQEFFEREYDDPGVEKWGGFLLSDHSARLRHRQNPGEESANEPDEQADDAKKAGS